MPFLAALIGILVTTALVATFTFASDTDADTPHPMHKHQEMKEIIENNDYDAWQALMQEKVEVMRERADTIKTSINEETFSKLIQAHELLEQGDREGAREIFEELGLKGPGPKGFKRGFKAGAHNCPYQK